MTRAIELTPLLKRLQLGPMAATLPERIALARREQLDYASFLEIILSDEVNRRAHRRIEMRLQGAGFQEICRLEDFDWSASITMDRRLLDAVFSLEFLDRHEHVLLVGPAGVGKSFLAQALGYSAVRAGHTVRFSHADHLPSSKSSSATRSTAGPTGASRCDCRVPASRRFAGWRTSLVGVHHHGPETAGRRLLPGVSGQHEHCWWVPPASARASWPRPSATPPSGPGTPSVSAMPTTSSEP